MKKAYQILQKSYLIFVAIIIGLAILCPVVSLNEINFWGTCGIIIFYLVLVLILYFITKHLPLENKKVEIISVIVIILLGLLLRIGVNHLLRTIPVSDFATPHDVYNLHHSGSDIFDIKKSSEELSFYQRYYATFPAWFPYMKVVSGIYNVFGVNLNFIKIMNYILFIITSLILYQTGKNAFSKKVGIIAIALFAFIPSLVVYTGITTPDHITIFLFTLWLWTWSKIIKHRENKNKKEIVIFSLIQFLIICLINLFKPLSVFGILVFLCTEILCYFKYLIDRESRKQYLKEGLIYTISFVIICFMSLQIENKVLSKVVEKEINNKVVDATSLYLLWGYSLDNNNNYDPAPASTIYENLLMKNKYDVAKTMEEINVLAKKQIINNKEYLARILKQKFNIIFESELDIFIWANVSGDDTHDFYIKEAYEDTYIFIASGYIIMLLTMIEIAIIKEIKAKNINNMIIVTTLIIIGYIFILVLGGVQARYKVLIFTPMCLLAACSLKNRKDEV